MKRSVLKKIALGSVLGFSAAVLSLVPNTASAVQFSYLDPGYTQEIYTQGIPTGWGPGFAWTSSGNMVLHGDGNFYEYSSTADTVYNGTNVHSVTATHSLPSGYGYGMTNGTDGFAYTNTSAGISQVNMNAWTTTTFAGSAGGYYGIGTLPDGRIVHNSSSSQIYVLNPTTGTDTLIYSSPSFIDGLAIAPTGEIFLADLGSYRIRVISSTGAVINDVAVSHGPDGMAFGDGAAFASNTDGTITRLDFAGPGYTGAVTETIFASGGTYGDLAAVGPDGAFYVSQWYNINWDNGVSTYDNAIVRIAAIGGGGFEPPPGTSPVPEPGTLLLVGSGLLGLAYARKKMKK
jgi:hypothetical protein